MKMVKKPNCSMFERRGERMRNVEALRNEGHDIINNLDFSVRMSREREDNS